MNKAEIKGYITNLGKYNEGYLIGEWVTFPIDEDDLAAVFERIGINEIYEEFFFTDWEYNELPDLELGEYENIDDINELAETLESLSDWELDTYAAAVEAWGVSEVSPDDVGDYNLYTDISDDYDLGYYYATEFYSADLEKSPLGNYIDYEAFGRDIRFESDGEHTSYGWIERS